MCNILLLYVQLVLVLFSDFNCVVVVAASPGACCVYEEDHEEHLEYVTTNYLQVID